VSRRLNLAASPVRSLLIIFLMGCSRNPNVEIVGSYFPGWMLSLAVGVVLTLAANSLLRRYGMDRTIGHPAIIYPSMVVLFTCLLWLCFFA
jgi:ABC-type transporter Mla maintaining outer membrane lipid asymmetry permease subunit MlaE